MPDENNQAVQQTVAETETAPVESPTTEAPITGEQTTQQEATVQTPVEEGSQEPAMSKEQARAFQEMRLENKRLKEEMEARPKAESAFDAFKQQAPVGPVAPVRLEQFQDPVTGETNYQAFNYAQQQREQQILAQARSEAQTTVQETLDEERARTRYPELMNDPVTEKQIAARWLFEKYQGNNVSISEIASEFARNFKQAVSKAEKVGAERVLNEVSEKEQAGLVAQTQSPSQAQRQTAQADYESLRVSTQKGDDDAITARISAIPWANK